MPVQTVLYPEEGCKKLFLNRGHQGGEERGREGDRGREGRGGCGYGGCGAVARGDVSGATEANMH